MIDGSNPSETLEDMLQEFRDLDTRITALKSEIKLAEITGDDRFFCLFGGMIYMAPTLLQALVRKCHDEEYGIDTKMEKMLGNHDLMVDGTVPENIKTYILNNFEITDENGISMHG